MKGRDFHYKSAVVCYCMTVFTFVTHHNANHYFNMQNALHVTWFLADFIIVDFSIFDRMVEMSESSIQVFKDDYTE
jgi:accessory gene regulator protein AgrB